MRVRSWTLLLLLFLLAPRARAQTLPPSLEAVGEGEPVAVSVAMHRGFPAYPAWVLRTLGARVDNTPEGARVVFGADTLLFRTGSPFFTSNGAPWQLVEPAYREGGIFYLPHQFYAEWLPRAYPDQLSYDAGHLQLKGTAASPPPADADSARAGASAPPDTVGRSHLVVIDAGHGGEDPGAIGPSGLKEKDIVLQVSKRLAKVLAARGYEVRMTRTTDTLIPLAQRPHLANEWRGKRPGLFISIHANNFGDRRVKGFETFFLSTARTEDERRVAEMENSAIAYESPSHTVRDTDDLSSILNNLRNDFYIRASHSLAGLVQKEFAGFHDGENRGVKQAGFRVLVGAFMPAVLVEVAFISNPTEERELGSGSFQLELARGIADAVDDFFREYDRLWTGAGQ